MDLGKGEIEEVEDAEGSGEAGGGAGVADPHVDQHEIAGADWEAGDDLLAGLLGEELGPGVEGAGVDVDEAQGEVGAVLLGTGLDEVGEAVAVEADPEGGEVGLVGFAEGVGDEPLAGDPVVGGSDGDALPPPRMGPVILKVRSSSKPLQLKELAGPACLDL